MKRMVEIKSNNLKLNGILHIPDEVKGKIPIVIIFHGFLGNKMGPHFILKKLSKALEESGIASIRFDFGGSGESEGEFEEMTMSKELADARTILNFVKSLSFVDTNSINVAGLSMGGAIASVLAGEYKEVINSLSLWAPAGNMGEVTWDYFIGSRKHEFLEKRCLDIDGLIMGEAFVQDVTKLDIYKKAAGYNGKVLIIHGDDDEVVPLKASRKYKELYGQNSELHILRGADHTFDKKEWEVEVIKLTVNFIIDNKNRSRERELIAN